MDLVPLVLCGLCICWGALKLLTLLQSIRWAAAHGRQFTEQAREWPPVTAPQQYALIEESGGGFRPFGAKSYKLRQRFFVDYDDVTWKRRLRAGGKFVCSFLWSAPLYMGLCGLLVEVINASVPDHRYHLGFAVSIVALGMVVYNIFLIVESVVWYVMVRSYARAYFFIGSLPTRPGTGTSSTQELLVPTTLLFFAVMNSTIAVSTVQLWYGGFGDLPSSTGVLSEMKRLVQSLYFVMSDMTTIGDQNISPVNTWPRITTMLTSTSQLLLVTVSVALLLSSISGNGTTD